MPEARVEKVCIRCRSSLPLRSFLAHGRESACCSVCRKSLRKFNVTPERYAALLEEQRNRCAICGTEEPGGMYKTWNIDHDHACCSGKGSCGKCVRALLCCRCNRVLGYIRDRWDLALKMYEYLDKHIHIGDK